MRFSERWLRTMVDPPIDTAALAERLTMAGLEVEADEPAAPPFSGVVVARVESVARHPDADKLAVCQVDAGDGALRQIVCGAPNVAAGVRVPCALPGARLPGGVEIGEATMRGVASRGMLCSARELGLSDEHAGLMLLDEDAPVGADMREHLLLPDRLLTLKLTPDLAHCLSVWGVAREVSAITGAPLVAPAWQAVPVAIDDRLPVRVSAPDLCGRFSGRVIRGVDARAATPDWMRVRLERSGQRSISALVDISNYVMLELGRPSHVFDLARVDGPLEVRWARAGESLELLNGQTVALAPDVGVIAAGDRVESLAGIMGGQATAVSLDTTDLYLEAAFWWPAAIAGRARRFNFSSEASHRFERGVDASTTVEHLERITALIVQICGGRAGPVDDTVIALPARPEVAMRVARARKVIGAPIAEAEMTAAFDRLGLTWRREGGSATATHVDPVSLPAGPTALSADPAIQPAASATNAADPVRLIVTPPAYRFDLAIEEDLIEEVARLYGYDRLPVRPPRAVATMRAAPESRLSMTALKRRLAGRDWQEVINFSFVSGRVDRELGGGAEPIALRNPIAEPLDVMRTTLWSGLVETLRHNLNRKAARVRVFEAGKVFRRDAQAAGGSLTVAGIDQPLRLAGLAWGPAWPEQWGAESRAVDFFDVKGDLQALLEPVRLDCTAAEHPALHPGRSARLSIAGRTVGWLGALHPMLQQRYGLPGEAPVLFEVEADAFLARPVATSREHSKFPPVVRDLAFVVDATVAAQALLAEIDAERAANALLSSLNSVSIFDEYRGKGLENKEKSLAFRFSFQDTRRTLTDHEVDAAAQAVVARLARALGARLRA